jgi:two-component system sensor histidine kinase PilS (NtrC family)
MKARRDTTAETAADTVPAHEDALLDDIGLGRPPPQDWKPTAQLPILDVEAQLSLPPIDTAAPEPYPPRLRIVRAFLLARASLAVLLLLIEGLLALYGSAPASLSLLLLCLIYAVLSSALLVWPARNSLADEVYGRHRRRWFLATTGVDVLVFSLLLPAAVTGLNFAALFALPVLMSGMLIGRRAALGSASAVALILLAHGWWQWLRGADLAVTFTQAGLIGAGMFTIAMLAGELATRLSTQEAESRSTLEMARQQATLNRLVIDEMQEGVMVVDRAGRVRAANPAALTLLDAQARERPAAFDLAWQPAWHELRQAVEMAYLTGDWPPEGRDVSMPSSRGPRQEKRLRVRMRFTKRRDRALREPLCVLFIEDLRAVQARARQEKLAAMGRVSAGIAHEIRNPLAAISQANALLTEDLVDPGLRQLARIVSDNVERLRRIVDDVLAVAPGGLGKGHVDAAPLELAPLVRSTCADWLSTQHPPPPPGLIKIEISDEPNLRAGFDAEHLRRVLINLLENGWRHGSRTAQAVWVKLAVHGTDVLSLIVASDGAPISADVEPHLFEPFFSTRSRGAGLGLYICRELCERNRASIEFQACARDARHRNAFVILMACSAAEAVPAPTARRR